MHCYSGVIPALLHRNDKGMFVLCIPSQTLQATFSEVWDGHIRGTPVYT